MPVLLTRPAAAVARATASLLLDAGAQVRLFGPDVPSELRARGAFAAIGALDDHGLLEAALAQVHTLVHVGGGLEVEHADHLVAEADLVLGAAERAGVQRVVVLSLPGAQGADDPLRAAAGRVEQDAAARPFPTVVVRTSLVDTNATRDLLASLPGTSLDDTVVAPVRVEDLAQGLVAVDEARSQASQGHVVFHANGPEPLTVAGYLQRIGLRGQDGTRDLVGRVYRPGGADAPGRRALAGPWTESDDGPTADLWAFADHTPSPVTA